MLDFLVVVALDQVEVFQIAEVDGQGSKAIQLAGEGGVDGVGVADSGNIVSILEGNNCSVSGVRGTLSRFSLENQKVTGSVGKLKRREFNRRSSLLAVWA